MSKVTIPPRGERQPTNKMPAKKLVIFLHGIGANGDDLMSISDLWASELPDCQFISPNAPQPFDFAPIGYQWFSMKSINPTDLMKSGSSARPLLDSFISQCRDKLMLDDGDIALVGFSQGGMMALEVAPRRLRSLAAVVSFSGALLTQNPAELKTAVPTLLIHGQEDEVVPFEAMAAAEAALKSAHIPVQSMARPGLGHGIDEAGLDAALNFIKNRFYPQ